MVEESQGWEGGQYDFEESREEVVKEEETEKESIKRLEEFEERWNRYKQRWCTKYRMDQDTTPKPIKTIEEIPLEVLQALEALRKPVKDRKFIANDTHVLIPRYLLSDHQRKNIIRKMKKGESTGRDVALFLEDEKGKMDTEASGSGLTEYHKWKTPTKDGRSGFVALPHFGYVGSSKSLPMYPLYRSYLFMITYNPRFSPLENTFFFRCAGPRFFINWLQDSFSVRKMKRNPFHPLGQQKVCFTLSSLTLLSID